MDVHVHVHGSNGRNGKTSFPVTTHISRVTECYFPMSDPIQRYTFVLATQFTNLHQLYDFTDKISAIFSNSDSLARIDRQILFQNVKC